MNIGHFSDMFLFYFMGESDKKLVNTSNVIVSGVF